ILGNKKTNIINNAKIIGDNNMPNFGSVASPVGGFIYLPVNVWNTKIIQQANVNILPTQATIGNRLAKPSMEKMLNCCKSNIAVKNISLLKKPLNGGSPAIEKLPIVAIENDTGIKVINPPKRRKSREPSMQSI